MSSSANFRIFIVVVAEVKAFLCGEKRSGEKTHPWRASVLMVPVHREEAPQPHVTLPVSQQHQTEEKTHIIFHIIKAFDYFLNKLRFAG